MVFDTESLFPDEAFIMLIGWHVVVIIKAIWICPIRMGRICLLNVTDGLSPKQTTPDRDKGGRRCMRLPCLPSCPPSLIPPHLYWCPQLKCFHGHLDSLCLFQSPWIPPWTLSGFGLCAALPVSIKMSVGDWFWLCTRMWWGACRAKSFHFSIVLCRLHLSALKAQD